MLVPVKWMKKYIDIDNSTREIADKVTDSGSHVESITDLSSELSNMVIGEIMEIRPHETMKKLSIIKLDLKDKEIELITGAKNMKVGDRVVAALEGASLPGGITIGIAEFGGVMSPGMLCSYDELAIADGAIPKEVKDGIIILKDDVEVGADALVELDMDQEVIEFEITPNRPDCLSMIGMARETAATFNKKITLPDNSLSKGIDRIEDHVKEIDLKTDSCHRFVARVMTDVKVTDSPQWIKNYLISAGVRPINNIVDLSNFVMLEYGQPLHIYDLDRINHEKITVRLAEDGEVFTSLDKEERKLEAGDIVICDGDNKPISLAGIMGGLDSEVTETTKNILIEAANFDSESIRKTSKRLGLKSEASYRFEKNIPLEYAEEASKRFVKLMLDQGDGKHIEGSLDAGKKKTDDIQIKLRPARANSLLGVDLDEKTIISYLESLELVVNKKDDYLLVDVPYFRSDLHIEADLIEEIGRLYGFHNIEAKPLRGDLTRGTKSKKRDFYDHLRNDLYALGYLETLTYSFISPKTYDRLNLKKENELRNSVKILNPLGEDFSVMRTTIIGNMLDLIKRNLNNKADDLRVFELGNIFMPDQEEVGIDNKVVTMGLMGDYDFYYLKDSLIKLLAKNGIDGLTFVANRENEIFHAGRCADVYIEDCKIGVIGEIDFLVRENYELSKRVYVCEINLDKAYDYKKPLTKYEKISKYPMIERDIALILEEEVESAKVVNIIEENGGDHLKFVQLFDIYTGDQIEDGKKSMAYKIGFQSNERTLKDKEVKKAFEEILEALNEAFNVNLRG